MQTVTDLSSGEFLGSQSCVFRKGTDEWGMFGNMTGGYPLYVDGVTWKSSEALYQACKFPNHPEIQEDIRAATNGFTAKLVAKANKQHIHSDWNDISIGCMIAAVYVKIASNPKLWYALEQTQGKHIVEISGKGDTFWGTVGFSTDDGDIVYRGKNILGKVWMLIRENSLTSKQIPVDIMTYLPTKDAFEGYTL